MKYLTDRERAIAIYELQMSKYRFMDTVDKQIEALRKPVVDAYDNKSVRRALDNKLTRSHTYIGQLGEEL
tara:strand:+ start:286 stop:495 length:210 start_codon:yes stop_codon:yes gene_type:complete